MSEKSSERAEMLAADRLSITELDEIALTGAHDAMRALVRRARFAGAETVQRGIETVSRRLGISYQRGRAHYYREARSVGFAEAEAIRRAMEEMIELEIERHALSARLDMAEMRLASGGGDLGHPVRPAPGPMVGAPCGPAGTPVLGSVTFIDDAGGGE